MTTRLPPGPRRHPFLQGISYAYRPVAFFDDCARRYGDVFLVRLPVGLPNVFFSSPAAIREIFTGGDELCAGKANAIVRPLLGSSSLLVLDGPRHTRERRLMLPPFHGERMLAYGETMRAITADALERWPIGRAFPVQPEMQAITLEVILQTVFGLADESLRATMRGGLRRLLGMVTNPMWLLPILQRDFGRLSPGGAFRRLKAEIDALLFAEFARRRAAGDTERGDVLSLLIAARDEDGQAMTDEELRDEMLTLLVAGHETTATALSWAFHHLLENPAALAALRDELGSGPIDAARVARLEYLDATAKETLRLSPVITEVGRALEQPTRIGGWDLPAGVVATASIFLVHRRPDVWADPVRFDPARFVGLRPSPYEFLPFGGGTRRCIGMAFALYEMKVVLAEVLSRVALAPAPGYRMRVMRRSITFAPSGGVPIVVTKRAA